MSRAVKIERKASRVIIDVDTRTAVMLAEICGLSNGLEDVYGGLNKVFDEPPSSSGYAAFKKWHQSLLRRYRLREPFINHAGVIVYDKPGKHGKHNYPHKFPCDAQAGGRP